MSQLHVVTGAGPVGSTVAQQLADHGHRVRLLTRSGSGPDHPLIEKVIADASRPETLVAPITGATAVFHCIHGSSYDATTWRAELPKADQAILGVAGEVGAVVVFPESLYSYGPVDRPITEDLPRAASAGKLGVRTELLRAREASATATVSVAASDFYGPAVRMAHAGERMVPTILAGRTMRVVGSLDEPHSFTYVPDLAAAMIVAAQRPDLHNTVLHAPTAPAVTQRELIEEFAAAAEMASPRMSAAPSWVFRAGGLVSRDMREIAETAYQFAAPFVLDSTRSETLLDLAPTPLAIGAKATVDWWRTAR